MKRQPERCKIQVQIQKIKILLACPRMALKGSSPNGTSCLSGSAKQFLQSETISGRFPDSLNKLIYSQRKLKRETRCTGIFVLVSDEGLSR